MKKLILFLTLIFAPFSSQEKLEAIPAWIAIPAEIFFISAGVGATIFCKKEIIDNCRYRLKFLEKLKNELGVKKIDDLTLEMLSSKKSLALAEEFNQLRFLRKIIQDPNFFKLFKLKYLLGKIGFGLGIGVAALSSLFLLKDVIKLFVNNSQESDEYGSENVNKNNNNKNNNNDNNSNNNDGGKGPKSKKIRLTEEDLAEINMGIEILKKELGELEDDYITSEKALLADIKAFEVRVSKIEYSYEKNEMRKLWGVLINRIRAKAEKYENETIEEEINKNKIKAHKCPIAQPLKCHGCFQKHKLDCSGANCGICHNVSGEGNVILEEVIEIEEKEPTEKEEVHRNVAGIFKKVKERLAKDKFLPEISEEK